MAGTFAPAIVSGSYLKWYAQVASTNVSPLPVASQISLKPNLLPPVPGTGVTARILVAPPDPIRYTQTLPFGAVGLVYEPEQPVKSAESPLPVPTTFALVSVMRLLAG